MIPCLSPISETRPDEICSIRSPRSPDENDTNTLPDGLDESTMYLGFRHKELISFDTRTIGTKKSSGERIELPVDQYCSPLDAGQADALDEVTLDEEE